LALQLLIVKLSSLGDVVQTAAVVQDVLQRFPDAQIDWVVEEAFAPLVSLVAGVRRVIPVAQRRWRTTSWSATTQRERTAFVRDLHAQNYDVVLDFQGLIKSALVARQARLRPGGFSATFANGSDACSYERPVRWLLRRSFPMPQRIHAVARYRLLAASALGYTTQDAAAVRWQFAAAAPTNTLVFAHGTTRADNEWSPQNWLALGHQLIAQGFAVALPQSNDMELARAQALAQTLGPQAHVWPRESLADVTRRMAACAGVVGVDSGLSHIAVALGLPHVQIFSQDRAWRAGPVGAAFQIAVGGTFTPDVSAVLQAWESAWAARPEQAV